MNYKEFSVDIVKQSCNAGADEAYANISVNDVYEVNFETRGIMLLRKVENVNVSLTVIKNNKKGSVSFNDISKESVKHFIEEALNSANISPQDEAYGSEKDSLEKDFIRNDIQLNKDLLYDSTAVFIEEVKRRYPNMHLEMSSAEFNNYEHFFANNYGRVLSYKTSFYGISPVFTAKDGKEASSFNYASILKYDIKEPFINWGTIDRLMKESSISTKSYKLKEKFEGDIVITPDVAYDMIGMLMSSINGYRIMSKTSPYIDKIDDIIASDIFSLYVKPSMNMPISVPFDNFGTLQEDMEIVKDGVLKNYMTDLYVSRKIGLKKTTMDSSFVVEPGNRSIDDIIKNIEKGIFLVRFSGGQPNNNLDFSGVAKNSFYIENGKIQYPLSETMISGNFKEVLSNIYAISKETVNNGYTVFPYIVSKGVIVS